MGRSRRQRLIGCALGLALVAAACGGGDDGGGATDATVDEGVSKGITDALGGGNAGAGSATTAFVEPTSMEDWQEVWAEERQAVIEKVKAGGWGLSPDGRTLTGPEGFTVDMSKCPAGWSNTEGLSDTSIKLGHTAALSGTLADYGNYGRAMGVLFEWVNTQGGGIPDVTGKTRSINLLVKDDGYDAARTIPLVDELIDSEKVFAVWTLGSPNTMKTYDKLNARCVPQPLAMTGHPAWGDPVNHPWTTGMSMAYTTEAILWGAFVEQRLAEFDGGQAKVAALVTNNEFGKAYDSGFKAFLAQSPNRDNIEFVTETVEPQTPTIKDPMTTLAAEDPDVFIGMLAGTPCTQAIIEASENGLKDGAQYLFVPSTCKASTFVGKEKVGGDGSASDGWWTIGGGSRDINSPGEDDNAYVQWARKLLLDKGIDPKSSGTLGSGFYYGWPMWQALLIAGQLEGV